MRPQVPLVFHLMLTGHSFSQACVRGQVKFNDVFVYV